MVKVGRIAGQFAKPRSSPTEMSAASASPSSAATSSTTTPPPAARPDPDPARHARPPTTSRRRRSTSCGPSPRAASPTCPGPHLEPGVRGLAAARPALRGHGRRDRAGPAVHARPAGSTCTEATLHQVDFFTSHEALILGYEEALTRKDSLTGDWYDTRRTCCGSASGPASSTAPTSSSCPGSNPWRQAGPDATPEEWSRCATSSTPTGEPGRLTLITASGPKVEAALPPLRAVRRSGHPVVWTCDPMHGNTFVPERAQDPALRRRPDEISGFFAACRAEGDWPGGVHVELTGDRRDRVPGRHRESSRTSSTCATRPPAIPGSTVASRSTWPSGSPTAPPG